MSHSSGQLSRPTTPMDLDPAGGDCASSAASMSSRSATNAFFNTLIPTITLAFGSVTCVIEEAVLRLRARALVSRIDACTQGHAPSRRINFPASNPHLILALLETILTSTYHLPSFSTLQDSELKPSRATFHIHVFRLLTHFDVPGGPSLAANNFIKITRGINHAPSFISLARELYAVSGPNDCRLKEILLIQALPHLGHMFASDEFDDFVDERDEFWEDTMEIVEAVWPRENTDREPFQEPRGRPTIRSL